MKFDECLARQATRMEIDILEVRIVKPDSWTESYGCGSSQINAQGRASRVQVDTPPRRRLGIDVERRACGEASARCRWPVALIFRLFDASSGMRK